MSILFHLADITKNPVKGKKTKITAWIKQIIFQHNKEVGDIDFIFCSNEYLLEINKKFLNHDYFTDVITFSYSEKNKLSGDIFISVDQVKLNAEQYKVTYHEELYRVVIHGILHLLGYEDDTDHKRMHMHVMEDNALEQLNL